MSLQVKFPFGRNHGPLHTCRDCGFASKERSVFDQHAKRCGKVTVLSSKPTSTAEASLPAPSVCRNYKCRRCEFATSKAKQYLKHLKIVHRENITIYPCDLCEYAAKHKSKVIRHRTLVHKDAAVMDSIVEKESSTALVVSDDEEQTLPVCQTMNNNSQRSEIVFPGGGVPPPVPHILEQNIPAPADAANYNAPVAVDEELDEEEDLSGLEMDGEDPEISFRVASMERGIELPYEEDGPSVASDLPHNPDPTEDAYDYIEPAPGGEEGIFKCKICTYKNPHKWKIANHIRTIHMKRKLFKCPYCDYVCERKIEWCVHKTSHTNKTVYSCKECLYRTTMKRNFDRHLNRHLIKGPYKCGICTYSSTGEAAIQRHMAEYHVDPSKENTSPDDARMSPAASASGNGRVTPDSGASVDTDSSPAQKVAAVSGGHIRCRICGLAFRTESKLRIHMVAHSNMTPFACPMCPLRYKRTADLNRHMKRKHGCQLGESKQDDPDQDQPLNLTVIKGEVNEQEQPLDLSVSSSPNSEKSVSNTPPSPDANRARQALVFKPENLKCSHCSYQAKWPSDLRRHLLVHSIEKRFRCQYCSKRYKYQFDLNMHMRKTHRISAGRTRVSNSGGPASTSALKSTPQLTTEQQLELEWNSMLEKDPLDGLPTMVPQRRAWEVPTSSPASVTSPAAAASASGVSVKLKCDYCPYIGKYRAEVERHMRLHTGNKPYSCMYCEYKSFWKGDMKRHLLKHHQLQVVEHGDLPQLVSATYSPSADVHTSVASRLCDHGEDDDEGHVEEGGEEEDPLLDDSIVKVEPLDADENPIYLQLERNNNSKLSFGSYESATAANSVPIENMSFEDCEVEQPDAKPGDKKVFKCPLCAFVCEAPSKLKCHYEIHGNLKRYMCPTCGKRSNWLWDVRKHIRRDHPTASMDVTELTEEEASATLEEYLMLHRSPNKTPRETPTREIPTSPVGGVLSADVAALLEQRVHSREVSPAVSTASQNSTRSNPTSRYRPYKCSECGRRSNWRWDLNKHIRGSSHPNAQVIVMDEEEARTTFEEEIMKRPQEKDGLKPANPLSSVSLQPSDIAKLSADRCRPFKCSECGCRSNWKWDMTKHIRSKHESATIILLSEEEARGTINEYIRDQQFEMQQRNQLQKLKRKYPGEGDELDCDTDGNGHHELDEADMEADNEYEDLEGEMEHSAIRAALLKPASSTNPGLRQHIDIGRLKRFKCSACPYRSNFRSDIGRHIKRKHPNITAQVVQLGYSEAAETLSQYRETFAKKKFVPSPSKSGSSGSVQSTPDSSPAKMSRMAEDFSVSENDVRSPGNTDEKSRVWRCSKCDFKDKNKMRVVKHFKKHARGMAFLCKLCGDTSDYRTSMYRHIRSKHQRQDFDNTVVLTAVQLVQTSPDGAETVLNSPELNNNTISSSSGSIAGYVWKNFKCSLCGTTSIYKGTIVRHIRERHKIEDALPHVQMEEKLSKSPPKVAEDETSASLRCKICPFETSKEGLLKMHMSYHKPAPGNKYKCKYCPYYVCATRMLDQHTRLHLKEQVQAKDYGKMVPPSGPRSAPSTPDSKTSNRARHFCDRCPYVSINRNDYLYHKQFHRPKSLAPFKCDLCPYWVSQRRLLTQHQKVHQPGYREHYSKGSSSAITSPESSPCKSIASDVSTDNVIQVAHIKQRIIAGKITSVPITPEKLTPDAPDSTPEDLTMPGYIVNKNGVLMASGAYRKLHKCRYCPYTNVRLHNLRLHEKMHGFRKGNLVKCQYCDYYVGNKGLLAHHIKVHSQQYRPGHDIINDFEIEKENQEQSVDGNQEGNPEEPTSEPEEENNNIPKDNKPSFRPDPTTQLSASALPNRSNYYIKYDGHTGEHILERAIFKKWCCEKCPYATMKRAQFERHSLLHGSKQKYTCEYCDYSVPGYHLLLQHKKLHMMPNPNLLSVQSISNLQDLPEVPADIAAAANFSVEESNVTHDHLSLYENTSCFTEPKKLYRCDRCPYTNVRRDHLLAHLKFHMIRSELTCPYCDYGVSKVHLLNQHIKVHFNTPGNEMNAESLQEGGSSPNGSSRSGELDQPEFIDISELGKKIKKTAEDVGDKKENKRGDKPLEVVEKESKAKDAEAIHVDAEGDNEVAHAEKNNTPRCTTEVTKGAAQAEKKATGQQGPERKDEKVAKDAELDGSVKACSSAKNRGNDWVCQYCDRAFNASEKLLRHEMQHLVGNKF